MGEESLTEEFDDHSKSDEQEIRSRSETPIVDTDKDTPGPAKGKKRKKSGDKMDRMETLVEKVMKMQNESEEHYLRLEEKMMEMEERRQKENHDFQLQLMRLLRGVTRQSDDSSLSRPGPSFNCHPMYSFTDFGDIPEDY